MESVPLGTVSRRETTFALDDKFDSFESLEKKIKEFEKEKHVVLCHRDTRTLEKAVETRKIKAERGAKNQSLVYYEMKYVCNHGGIHKPLGEGKRATNTFKQQCPFKICVRLSRDGILVKRLSNIPENAI